MSYSFEAIIYIEDEETQRLLGTQDDVGDIKVHVEFTYEPADPDVGIMSEHFDIYNVIKENGREYDLSDFNQSIQQSINDQLKDHVEDERAEAEIAKYESYMEDRYEY